MNNMSNRYVLSILVENRSGVLRRVAGLFSRRGYNIESLTVAETEDRGISRITAVVSGDLLVVDQIMKQMAKLVEVIRISLLGTQEAVYRELVLIKVETTPQTRGEILEIVGIFRAKVVDVDASSIVVEVIGHGKKLEAAIEMLEPFGIIEMVRTGLAAMERGNKQFKSEDNQ